MIRYLKHKTVKEWINGLDYSAWRSPGCDVSPVLLFCEEKMQGAESG